MKAWVLHDIGDIRFEEVPDPVPAAGEVVVAVKAAGICGSDIPRIFETGAHRMPLVPGHEFSGVVEELGDGVEEHWLGKRIGVFPLIPCGTCGPCREGQFELCRNYDYTGSRRDGAFAERVAVPVKNLVELPGGVTFEQAAMLEPMSVAVHAMRRGSIDFAAAKVAVCGLGPIGLLLVGFLLDAGVAQLFCIGNRESQRMRALAMGIPEDRCFDSSAGDAAAWLRDRNGGVDLYFDCVGRPETCVMGIEAAAPMGRIVLVGNPHSDVDLPRDVYWKILRNQLTLTGTWNSSVADDWHYVLQRLQSGAVSPEKLITHRLTLEELGRGFTLMRDKSEDFCKVMMTETTLCV